MLRDLASVSGEDPAALDGVDVDSLLREGGFDDFDDDDAAGGGDGGGHDGADFSLDGPTVDPSASGRQLSAQLRRLKAEIDALGAGEAAALEAEVGAADARDARESTAAGRKRAAPTPEAAAAAAADSPSSRRPLAPAHTSTTDVNPDGDENDEDDDGSDDDEAHGLPAGTTARALRAFRNDPFAQELGDMFSAASSSDNSGVPVAAATAAIGREGGAAWAGGGGRRRGAASHSSRAPSGGADVADADDEDGDDDFASGGPGGDYGDAEEPDSLDRVTFLAAAPALGIDPFAITPASLGLGGMRDVEAAWAEALDDVDLEAEGGGLDATDGKGRMLTVRQRRAMAVARGLLAYLPRHRGGGSGGGGGGSRPRDGGRGGGAVAADEVSVDWRRFAGLGITLEGLLERAGLGEHELLTAPPSEVQRAIKRALGKFEAGAAGRAIQLGP